MHILYIQVHECSKTIQAAADDTISAPVCTYVYVYAPRCNYDVSAPDMFHSLIASNAAIRDK